MSDVLDSIVLEMASRAVGAATALYLLKSGQLDELIRQALRDGRGFCEYIEFCLGCDESSESKEVQNGLRFLDAIRGMGLEDLVYSRNRVVSGFLENAMLSISVSDKRLTEMAEYLLRCGSTLALFISYDNV